MTSETFAARARDFYADVDRIATASGCGILDAVVHWCESRALEIESVVPLIMRNERLRSALKEDAERLNFLKRGSRLPV